MPQAEARSLKLLMDWLTPTQFWAFATTNAFEVVGGDTGRVYLITKNSVWNILAPNGKKLCVVPDGVDGLTGDRLLAQKIGLERDERATLQVANRS